MAFTYKGLQATLDRHLVTEEEVNRQLQRLVQENPRIAEIKDRPTENGDEVVLDYAGFCDGEQFAGGTAENQTLVLGSGAFIPGFEEQLLDKVPGEKVTVKVTFPEQYHADNLAGKEAEFICTIHSIRVKTPYELDDTFAREFGGCDSLEDMRNRLQESMQAYADQQGEMELQDKLLRMAAETLDYTPDDAEVEKSIDQQMETMKAQLAQQGLSLEMYCSFMQTDEKTLREDSRQSAIAALRSKAAIDKVVELEGLKAEASEIAQAVEIICRRNNMTLKQLEPYRDAEFDSVVTHSVLTGKVLHLIRENAVLTEV